MMSNYSHSQKCQLLHAFEHLKEYGPNCKFVGLCSNLQAALDMLYPEADTFNIAYEFMQDVVETWPEVFKDDQGHPWLEYPIDGRNGYERSSDDSSMFDKSTGHGLKRYRLIDYCIQRLKDELSS
jgi:hypothetical protein